MNTANLQNGAPRIFSKAICAYKPCGAEFVKGSARQRYCNEQCAHRVHAEAARARQPAKSLQIVTRDCEQCQQPFSRKCYDGPVPRFCSKRCGSMHHQERKRSELAAVRVGIEHCKSCGLDLRLISCGRVACWLKNCPVRTEPVSDAELDAFARQLACASLVGREQIEAGDAGLSFPRERELPVTNAFSHKAASSDGPSQSEASPPDAYGLDIVAADTARF